MATGVRVEEVTTVTYGDGTMMKPWPVSWSAVWIGTLSAIALALIFGLVGTAVGAHRVGHPFASWKDVGFLALVWSVFGAFLSFVLGGWVATKVAGFRQSETGMLHGAIVWLVAVPILLVLVSLGSFCSLVLGGWVATKVAGFRQSETGMLHGAIVWLVAVPILLVLLSLGASTYLGGWYGGLAGTPAWVIQPPVAAQDPVAA